MRIIALLLAVLVVGILAGIISDHYHVLPLTELIAIKRTIVSGDVTEPPNWPTQNQSWQVRSRQYDRFKRTVDIVMIGDSRTVEGDWQDEFPAARIANRGIGGDTTYGVLSRLEGIKKTGAKTALIMIGVNDFLSGRQVGEVVTNYQSIVKTLKRFGMRVVIQSTVQTNGRRDDWLHHDKTNTEIKELNVRLKQIAAANNILFVDLDQEFSDPQGLKDTLTTDGIHFNDQGYDVWYQSVERYMRTLHR